MPRLLRRVNRRAWERRPRVPTRAWLHRSATRVEGRWQSAPPGVHSVPPKANHVLEADVTDQIYPPKRPNMAHFEIPERETEQDDWKAQLGQLLDDYRNQYVLPRNSSEKPAP
jgi:hypothetical protein